MVAPRREMALEEAVARALVAARHDPTLVRVLPVLFVGQEEQLDPQKLVSLARRRRVAAELGMMLDLTAVLSRRTWVADLAATLPGNKGLPRYYPTPRGGRYGRALADARTPHVVAMRGFRMNFEEDDLRAFLLKHVEAQRLGEVRSASTSGRRRLVKAAPPRSSRA